MDNREQRDYWNGTAGQQWAKEDVMMSRLLEPVSDILLEGDQLATARRVLCVGCGGGSDTLRLIKGLDASATVTGVDISEPLLEVARSRIADEPEIARRLSYLLADAGTDSIGDGNFDLVYSRFGVMFFSDPEAAFRNLATQCAEKAQLRFVCWQAAALNSWVTVPLKGALSVLEPPPPPTPRAPGPFAFAESEYVVSLLEASGWTDVGVEPRSLTLRWGDSADVAINAKDLLKTGPVGRLLVDADEPTRQRVYAAVTEALAPYSDGEGLALEGAIWLVTAQRAPS